MNKRTSKVKNVILILVVMAFLVAIIGGTYARYSSSGLASANASIAKWHIELNGADISSAATTVNVAATKIDNVSNENVSNGKIAPGQTLGATLEVDPKGSEVAVDYNFSIGDINTTGFNSSSKIVVTKVMATVEGGTAEEVETTQTGYAYSESLADVLAGKKVSFVVYVTWADENNSADTENGASDLTSIEFPIDIVAKQHVATDPIAARVDTDDQLREALTTLTPGSTVTITSNIDNTNKGDPNNGEDPTMGTIVSLPSNSTIDLGGNELKVVKWSYSFHGGDNITIKNGSIEATPGTTYGLFIWDDNQIHDGVVVDNITVDGGVCTKNATNVVLRNVNAASHRQFYTVYCNTNSTMTIESGTYSACDKTTALLGYCIEDEGTTNPTDGMVITGGTFITNGKPLYLNNETHAAPVIHGGIYDRDITKNGEITLEEGYEINQISADRWEVSHK